ncbi:hypothetical protein C1N59_11115 [Pantoea sp. SGAir0183]
MARSATQFSIMICFKRVFMGFSCGEAGCRIRKQQDAAQQGEDAMQDFSPLQNSAPAYRKNI